MERYTSTDILDRLKQRLEPVPRAQEMIDEVATGVYGAREAAVLLPLFERNEELWIALIRRASTLRSHSGEIAFPGGAKEEGDETPVMTALREAQEEIGIDPERVEVLGVLAPVFTVVSNYIVMPVVGYLSWGLGTLRLQENEVAEVIEIPLRELADPAIMRTEEWTRGGVTRIIYFYDYGAYNIWGATGRMISAFLEKLAADILKE